MERTWHPLLIWSPETGSQTSSKPYDGAVASESATSFLVYNTVVSLFCRSSCRNVRKFDSFVKLDNCVHTMDAMCLRLLTFLVVGVIMAVAAEQLELNDTESTTAIKPTNALWKCFSTFPWKRPYFSCTQAASSKRRALVDFRGMSLPYIANSNVPTGKWISRSLVATTDKPHTVTKQDSGNWFLG